MNEDCILKLHANCVPVKGARRSIICDLHYNTYKFIPNILYTILTEHKSKTLKEIKEIYGNKHDVEILEFFSFLLEEDLGFECLKNEFPHYPDLDFKWESAGLISNSIIDINNSSRYDLGKVAKELSNLSCVATQIRYFSSVSIEFISSTLKPFDSTKIQSLELLFPYSQFINDEDLYKLCACFPRISLITVYSSPVANEFDINPLGVTIHYIKDLIESSSHCGVINPSLFNVNQQMFLEAKNFNSCLNKKISVDVDGNIKNCPSLHKSYGHTTDTSLFEALNDHEFKTIWNVTKDQVNICSVCEFRYICTDCRAFVEEKTNLHGKPIKCTYDPYDAVWN